MVSIIKRTAIFSTTLLLAAFAYYYYSTVLADALAVPDPPRLLDSVHNFRDLGGSLATVKPHYLQAAFDQIEDQYGSVDNYLMEGLGLDEDALTTLHERFLE